MVDAKAMGVNNMTGLAVWLVVKVKDETVDQIQRAKAIFNKDSQGIMAAADIPKEAIEHINKVFDWIIDKKQKGERMI